MEVKCFHGKGNNIFFDCSGCDKKALNDKEKIKEFLIRVSDSIEMKRLTEPVVVSYKHKHNEESGITGFVIIAESHISIHSYPEKAEAFVDVFSCREFDSEKVVAVLNEFFFPKKIEKNMNFRGTGTLNLDDLTQAVKGTTDSKTIPELVSAMKSIGFQATHLSKAAEIIHKMQEEKCTVFLSFTSNMVSSGLRELFAFMLKHKMVSAVITSVGSVEEDLMKTHKPFLLGSFDVNDLELHKKGINRIGNVFVPNERYEWLEKQLMPFFSEMLLKQKEKGKMLSASEIIFELGKKIKDENSILYWATKNNIPVFCPAITDGAFGLQLFSFKQRNKEFGIDVTADMQELADLVLAADKTAGIILGGGIAKHHTIGINILRDGLNYAVYVSTATESDGSLSGAKVKEAVSWGKINETADHVFVEGDATILFPLLFYSMKENLVKRNKK
ncbi:MAG: deoxyhypusine synthase [archaeon]